MARYVVSFVGLVTVATPGTPTPAVDVLPTSVTATASGGAKFDLTAVGNLPTSIRALWLPADFDQATPAEAIFNSAHPSVDVTPTGTVPIAVEPPATLPAAQYLLALVSVFPV